MNRLRKRELCPLHKSYWCECHGGRNSFLVRKKKSVRSTPFRPQLAVDRVEDPHHPRGFREICSLKEKRRRKNELIASGAGCLYCPEPFTNYREIELAHKEPKGMGGSSGASAFHDDHMDNLGLAHRSCNHANGSKHYVEKSA